MKKTLLLEQKENEFIQFEKEFLALTGFNLDKIIDDGVISFEDGKSIFWLNQFGYETSDFNGSLRKLWRKELEELTLDDDIIVDEAKDAAENVGESANHGGFSDFLSKYPLTPSEVFNKSVPTKAEQTLIAMRDMLIEQFPLADGDLRQVISDLKRDKQMITDRKNEEITKLRAEIEGLENQLVRIGKMFDRNSVKQYAFWAIQFIAKKEADGHKKNWHKDEIDEYIDSEIDG